jgi:hypothetical protein
MADDTEQLEEDCHRASSEAYGQLVRATADICLPRYHYFCDDAVAKLPNELIVVANTRRVPIRDNDLVQVGSDVGALEAVRVKGKDKGALRLAPVDKKEVTEWKKALHDDFSLIEKFEPRPNYVCVSEFGFPFGLRHQESMPIPPAADQEWDWLQDTEYLTKRFVCLGSAHRQYRREKGKNDLRYENLAVVYPNGKGASRHAKEVFESKRDVLAERLSSEEAERERRDPGDRVPEIRGVRLSRRGSDKARGISAYFKKEGKSADVRSDLSLKDFARIDPDSRQLAKDAFDFYDATADAGMPPIYIRKNSPARKLGEYIDVEGKIELDVFVTDFGVVSVLICYDAFEPSIFLSAVRMYYESMGKKGGFYHQGIDIFFIPSFNRSQKFVDMCRVLSSETNSMVVYVSGDERCEDKSKIFVCGETCAEWAAQMVTDEEGKKTGSPKEYFTKTLIPKHEHLHIYKISRKLVLAAQQEMAKQFPPDIRESLILTPRRMGTAMLQ